MNRGFQWLFEKHGEHTRNVFEDICRVMFKKEYPNDAVHKCARSRSSPLSTLFLYSESVTNYRDIMQNVVSNLIYDNGSWTSKSINLIREMGIEVSKLKHGINEPKHRARIIEKHIGRLG